MRAPCHAGRRRDRGADAGRHQLAVRLDQLVDHRLDLGDA